MNFKINAYAAYSKTWQLVINTSKSKIVDIWWYKKQTIRKHEQIQIFNNLV